jgi:YHS domain-containing protein
MRTAIDPVCEQEVLTWWSTVRGLYLDMAGNRFFFCSRDCQRKFENHPAAYTMAEDYWRASDDGMPQPEEIETEWS